MVTEKRNNNRRLILNLAVLLCFLLFLAWVNTGAREKRSIPPRREGETPELYRVTSQRDIYEVYKRHGLWGARVVQVNRFLNMVDYFPREELRSAPFPLTTFDVRPLYEKGLDAHNWLFIAAMTGMARSVLVVLPEEVFRERGEALKATFHAAAPGHSIKGYTYDVPMLVATMNDMPTVDEPVVMNVDAGFFLGKTDPVTAARMLKERCPDVRLIVLAGSDDEPDVTPGMKDSLARFEAAWRAF